MTATADDLYDPKKLDIYEYDENPSLLRRILWYCAGADANLLKHCPRSERVKEEGIGGIVLATALLAFVSGSYAMYVVFGPKVGLALSPEQQAIDTNALIKALIAGFIWSMVILNLDRFVVSSTGHGDGTDAIRWGEFWRAVPRILMAMVIGICLSAPLEIRVMKSEIEAELRTRQVEYVKKADEKYEIDSQKRIDFAETRRTEAESKIKKINDDFQKRENAILAQRKTLDDEAGGKSANGRAGMGPAYAAKMKNLEELKAELDASRERAKPEIDALGAETKARLKEIENEREQRKGKSAESALAATNMDGLMTRIHIAHDIGGWAVWLLSALLIIIEVGPIFFKMMMPKGPYLSLLENQNEMALAKYAIWQEKVAKPGEKNEVEIKERYRRAETLYEFEAEQLQAETRLANFARERFIELTEADIRVNPARYMNEVPVATR